MSLYNTLFGVNPATPLLIGALELDKNVPENWEERYEKITDTWGEPNWDCEDGIALMNDCKKNRYYPTGRFRDIFFQNEEGSEPKIVLYTRNGGGNRDWYSYVFELLSEHPLYIQNYDDDFDSTYAYIEFKSPQIVIDFFDGVKTGKLETVSEKFQKEIQDMENGKEPNEQVMSFMKNIVEQISQKVDDKG